MVKKIDWEQMKRLYPELEEGQIECMQEKQMDEGFDSDCFAHCRGYDSCMDAFYNKEKRIE